LWKSGNANLKLLSRSCTLWKYLSIHNKVLVLKYSYFFQLFFLGFQWMWIVPDNNCMDSDLEV
jgi:hypothetical protein